MSEGAAAPPLQRNATLDGLRYVAAAAFREHVKQTLVVRVEPAQ